jgi:hypothetical protein
MTDLQGAVENCHGPAEASQVNPGQMHQLWRDSAMTRSRWWAIVPVAVVLASALVFGVAPRPVRPVAPAALPDVQAGCAEAQPYFVVVCQPPTWGNPAKLAGSDTAILLFRDTPSDSPQYQLADRRDLGTLWGLAYSQRESALYAGAFRRRGSRLGPGGIGAIYRLDLATGAIAVLAIVPNAAAEEPRITESDDAGFREAGRIGLGDIDLNEAETELSVVNLYDRRIYRYSVPSGVMLGSFPNGASSEPWANDARPFGLAYHGGRLYHAVVNSAEHTRQARDPTAAVYSRAPGGRDLRAVARI